MKSREDRLLELYDIYLENMILLAQSGLDKDSCEVIRKFLKDEGMDAEKADRRAQVGQLTAITDGLPVFDPEEDL